MPNFQPFLNYLSFEKRVSEHTITAYSNDLVQFFGYSENSYGVKSYKEITKAIIKSWMAELLVKGLSKPSINRKISSVKSYFQYLERSESLSLNPATEIKLLKKEKRLPEFVPESNLNNLFEMVKFSEQYEGQRDRLILALLYATGMRSAELIGIQVKNIDIHQKRIKVLGKRNKERIIPLHNEVVEMLKVFMTGFVSQNQDYLFVTKTGKKIYPKLVYRIVNSYLSQATTLTKRSPHVLRHTFATHMLNKGADINSVKELLGHASLAATEVYTHNTFEKLNTIYKQAHPRA